MIVLDDYEGELAMAPGIMRLRQLAEVQILNRPITPDDHHILKDCQILFALRERTTLDSQFFEACPDLELVLQTGGHAYHIDQLAAFKQGVVIALGRRVSKPTVVIPELVFSLMLGLVRQIYSLTTEMHNGG
jgi:D-3-phosphoglycerate dehydrogenase / 2-oxoglutarate reductase